MLSPALHILLRRLSTADCASWGCILLDGGCTMEDGKQVGKDEERKRPGVAAASAVIVDVRKESYGI